VSLCVASFGAGQRPYPGEGFQAAFGRIFGGSLGSSEDERRSRRKALALFCAVAIYSIPQCRLPQEIAAL